MYRARDEFANEEWLAELEAAATDLALDAAARDAGGDARAEAAFWRAVLTRSRWGDRHSFT